MIYLYFKSLDSLGARANDLGLELKSLGTTALYSPAPRRVCVVHPYEYEEGLKLNENNACSAQPFSRKRLKC